MNRYSNSLVIKEAKLKQQWITQHTQNNRKEKERGRVGERWREGEKEARKEEKEERGRKMNR